MIYWIIFSHTYLNSFFLRHLTLKIILINHPCTYLYSTYNSPLVNIFCFKNPFDYLIEKYANPWKIMKRKCGGRRFTLIFEELRFLAISQSLVSFFLRRKKKTMDNCCHNYVPYVCYVRLTVIYQLFPILRKIFCITVVIVRSQQKEEWQKKRSFRRRKTRSTINRWGNIHESKKNLWNTRTLGAKTFRWSKDLEALVHDPVSDSLKPTLRQKGAPCSVHKSSVSRVKGSAREASINFIVYSLPSNFHASIIRNFCWVY